MVCTRKRLSVQNTRLEARGQLHVGLGEQQGGGWPGGGD